MIKHLFVPATTDKYNTGPCQRCGRQAKCHPLPGYLTGETPDRSDEGFRR